MAAVVNNTLQLVSLDSSVTITSVGTGNEVKLAPSPLNAVAVTLPVKLIVPVPLIVLLLRSKLPPNCGVVSDTTSPIAPT